MLRRRRPRPALVLAGILVTALALTGCTADPTPGPTPSGSSAVSALLPDYPADFTLAAAQSVTETIGKRIAGQVAQTSVINDDVHSVDNPATESSGEFWGVIHTLTLEQGVDPLVQAQAVITALESAGWLVGPVKSEKATFSAVFVSDANANKAWLVAVGADSSVAGQSVVTLQLTSPFIP